MLRNIFKKFGALDRDISVTEISFIFSGINVFLIKRFFHPISFISNLFISCEVYYQPY